MNAQEIFSKVATHLLTQNKRSVRGASCLYRSGGLMCAVGCLLADLPDSDVRKVEHKLALDPAVQSLLIKAGVITTPHEYDGLLDNLQRIHDEHSEGEWHDLLSQFATNHNLEMP